MNGDTYFYHPVEAPDGKLFDSTTNSFEELERKGWVDNPAKIEIDSWIASEESSTSENGENYLSGSIPGSQELKLVTGQTTILAAKFGAQSQLSS